MCDFLDEDGIKIEAGDIIERWNRNDREWYKYKVIEVKTLQRLKTIYGPAPGYINQGEQKVSETSLKAFCEDRYFNKGGWAHNQSVLKKSKGIRKVQ